MPRVCTALAFAALIPITAHAEPITVNLYSSGGFQEATGVTTGSSSIDLGALNLNGGSSTTFYISGLRQSSNYTVDLSLSGSMDEFRVELLDPSGDANDSMDEGESGAPSGYSGSNNVDGLSFAQDAGLERSAVFAGGSALITADEKTHRGDILLFSGLSGAEDARVTFGLRNHGANGFLLQITALGGMAEAPEPATMLLLGTGLAGLAAARRRLGRRQV
jgi:hypothetical protein